MSAVEELCEAATKVREHAEIFGGAAGQIITLLNHVAEIAETDGGIWTSTEARVLDAARAINGGAL